MIRSAANRAMLLAAAALFIGAAVTNCSKAKDHGVATEETGAVDLALSLSPNVTVNTVTYTITGNGISPITGTVNVSNPGATVSLLISGVPAGTGYTIRLDATSTDGGTTCVGSSPFSIVAGATTSVTIVMQCTGPDGTGDLQVNATTNNCPSLTSFAVSPITIGVGGTISLNASATDLDAGTTISYAWSTNGGGTFASPSSASTSFTCTPVGSQTLTLTFSDGQCPKTKTVVVSCSGTGGGTGGVPGTGGAGTGGTGTGGTGTGGAGTGGAGTGGTGTGGTGTGGTGTGGTGTGGAGTGGAGTGGAGTGGSPGTGGAGAGGSTGFIESPACTACVAANCAEDGPGCSSLTDPAKRALCESLFACVRRTNCGATSNTVCWCGTASPPVCSSTPGAANGPCLDEEVAAAESTDLATISARYNNPTFASGAVHNRIACERDLCATECPGPGTGQ